MSKNLEKEQGGCALPAQLYTTEASASAKKTKEELEAQLQDDDDVFATLVKDATKDRK